jgi:hypothetical protein
MTRAYLRLDPHLFDRKVVDQGYPAGAIAAYVAIICLGDEQPKRGRFRSERMLRLLMDEPRGGVALRWGKWVSYLMSHGDLTRLPDGQVYIDGWDEWQEGDVTVQDRMQRLRDRRKRNRESGPVTTGTVTLNVTPAVNIPSERRAESVERRAVSVKGSESATRSVPHAPVMVAADARKEH